jgi:hypothetical protein
VIVGYYLRRPIIGITPGTSLMLIRRCCDDVAARR